MSAQGGNPYSGFGYHSGMVQALGQQFRGEAEARAIALQQEQIRTRNELAKQEMMANIANQRLVAEGRQKSDDLAERKFEYDKANDEANRGVRLKEIERKESNDEFDQNNPGWNRAGGFGRGLTPLQQIEKQKELQQLDMGLDALDRSRNQAKGKTGKIDVIMPDGSLQKREARQHWDDMTSKINAAVKWRENLGGMVEQYAPVRGRQPAVAPTAPGVEALWTPHGAATTPAQPMAPEAISEERIGAILRKFKVGAYVSKEELAALKEYRAKIGSR